MLIKNGKAVPWGAVLALALCLSLGACSSGGEEKEVKGMIDTVTDKAAEAAVKKMKTPIDKARLVKDLGADRLDQIEQGVQNQNQ